MNNTKTGNFWGILGKLVAILTAAWIIIQIISHFSDPNDIKMEINGNHYPYNIAYKHKKLINEYKEILALDKSYTDNINENGMSIKKLNSLKDYNVTDDEIKNYRFKSDYNAYMDYNPIINIENYNEIWSFNILNKGQKPIEDLIIEIPFKGYYKLLTQKGKSSRGDFENRIQVGNLDPGYSLSVIAWVVNGGYPSPGYNEEKTRVTHKYGWKEIDYPVRIYGLLAWNKRNYNTPLFITIVTIIFILFITFFKGFEYGSKAQKKEDEHKLKELKEEGELITKSNNDNKKNNDVSNAKDKK